MKIIDKFNLVNQPGEVGLEIEMEGRNLRFLDLEVENLWHEEDDGSLRGDSVEYILQRPIPRKKVLKSLEYLDQKIQDAGIQPQPSERCGVHVHINCQKMTENEVVSFMILYFVLESVLVHYCGEDREGNLFCLRCKDAEGLLELIFHAIKYKDLSYMIIPNIRYSSLNIQSLRKFGSLEFRSLRTPRHIEEIATWVDLLLKVKDHSLKYKKPQEIIEELSSLGVQTFLRNVFKDQFNLIEYKNMQDDVMEDVRRVQFLAYSFEPFQGQVKKEKPMKRKMRQRIVFDDIPPPPEPRPNRDNPAVEDWHFDILDNMINVNNPRRNR